jgi:hypothetical protein
MLKNVNFNLNNYIPSVTNKEELGEVFTPEIIIERMLEQIPDKYWTNKKLKWFDPSAGVGNFMVYVYFKLMKTLKSTIKNKTKRHKHIISNMLYMVEIKKSSVNVIYEIFGKEANVFQGDFFHFDQKQKFDCIIGNPPYNLNGIRYINSNLKQSKKGMVTIWPNFVTKSLSMLKNKNSFTLLLHPSSWISLKGSEITNTIMNYQIQTLRCYDIRETRRLFGGDISISLTSTFLLNHEPYKQTFIYDCFVNRYMPFDILKYNFIPTSAITVLKKVLDMSRKYGSLEDLYINSKRTEKKNRSLTKTEIHRYPLINIKEKKIVITYGNYNFNVNSDPKLIFSNFSMGYPVLDTSGNCYPCSNMMHLLYMDSIECLRKVQHFFYTPLVLFLINITKTNQKFLNNIIFNILPNICNIENFSINDFNFTKDEIRIINTNYEGNISKNEIKNLLCF